MTHHCRSIPVIRSSAHNFQPISSQHCQRHRGTSDENKPSELGKETNSYFPCAFRVYGESYVCTAGVRCGRWDLGVTSVLFPSYYCVSQVGATREEFPRVYGNFSYTRGTFAVWPRVLRCVTVWSGVS